MNLRNVNFYDINDENRINELTNHERSDFRQELGKLFIDIEECVNNSEQPPADIDRETHVVNAIEGEIDNEDLATVTTKLDEINDAKDLYDSHKDNHKYSYKNFGKLAVLSMVFAGLIFISAAQEGDLSAGNWTLIQMIVFSIGFWYFFQGYNYFKSGQKCKEKFEEKWRNYKRVD